MNAERGMVYIADQKRAERIHVEVRDWLESNRKDMGMYILGKKII